MIYYYNHLLHLLQHMSIQILAQQKQKKVVNVFQLQQESNAGVCGTKNQMALIVIFNRGFI